MPNRSVGPNLPHALPGGPLGSSGSGEKGGCEVSRSGSEALSDEIGIQGDSALADRVVDLPKLDHKSCHSFRAQASPPSVFNGSPATFAIAVMSRVLKLRYIFNPIYGSPKYDESLPD